MDELPRAAPPHDVIGPRGQAPAIGRRRLLRVLGGGAAVGVGGAAGFGSAVYRDRASARSRSDSATFPSGSTARSVRVIWRAETDRKVMALTFDDGPGDVLTAPLLDVLRDARVPATFCLVGREARERQDLVKRQLAAGHEVVNHSWSHPDLCLLSMADLSGQLERTDQLLYELSGARPRFVRPPFGRVSGALLKHAAVSGQDVLLWDVRFKEATYDLAGNVAHVTQEMGPGSVLLGHDAGSADRAIGMQAVPELIREARARGYEFVTASTLADLESVTSLA